MRRAEVARPKPECKQGHSVDGTTCFWHGHRPIEFLGK
jgi:hypothetical protein